MLVVRDLRKTYGTTIALAGVDVDAAPGEVVALLGPNGAGKTTLVSIIAGLRRADSGSVTVGDVDALAHPQRARELLGLAPQDLGIYPIVSVVQNLRLFGEIAGLRRRELDQRITDVAAALSLDGLLGRLAGTLSGGEKRRLHTAIALLHRPRLLLLDEATTGADVATRGDLLGVVRRLADDGAAVVYSTHYMEEVASLRARVTILDHGTVIAKGPLDQLLAAHASAFVEMVFDGPVPAVLLGDGVTVEGSTVRLPTADPGHSAAAALATIGADASRLRALEIVEPNLESVYVTLTGRRYSENAPEDADVMAS
ncbi:MAG: ATP-binding cassette domain-containing protein [Nitriliruptorales bacterium]|nr:ATP-binding cassette domain-containing protein [Nitriliruptorales bacterium]